MLNSDKTGCIDGEVKDRPERSSRDLFWLWLCWLGVAVMLYVLSSGPVMMAYDKLHIRDGSSADQVLEILYGPMFWVARNTLLQKPLVMYWHLWAPGQSVSHAK